MSKTLDMFHQAIQALDAGKDPMAATGGVDNSELEGMQDDGGYVTSSQSEDYRPFADESDDVGSQDEDSSNQDEGTADAKAESSEDKKTSGAKELVTITDDKGKRKVAVDFSDRKKMEQFVQLAYGSRKWQTERDQERQAHQATQEKYKPIEENWNKLNKAWEVGGVEGLVELLEGPGGFQKWKDDVLAREAALAKMSPDARRAALAEEAEQKRLGEIERIRQENEEFRKSVEQEREASKVSALEAKVHPVFHKHSFAGKLGDADTEEMFDDMLWNKALERLTPYEEAGVNITPELIEREYAKVASSLRRHIAGQAEKKASKVVEKKKQQATESVQADLKSGYKPNSAKKELQDLMSKGDTRSIIANFGKFGNLLK